MPRNEQLRYLGLYLALDILKLQKFLLVLKFLVKAYSAFIVAA
jgi:hypothetical protein